MTTLKSWFAIDGRLDPIPYSGESYFRFPEELARVVIEQFSRPADWIVDPFIGFGTTVAAAQALGRNVVGFEIDRDRHKFASARCLPPSKVIHDDVNNLERHELPKCDLLFTSPPYGSFRDPNAVDMEIYLCDFDRLFSSFKILLKPTATLIVEISNTRVNGVVRPIA